jgi:signal peptidase II
MSAMTPRIRSCADAARRISTAQARGASLRNTFVRWLLLAALVIVLDQASKAAVLASFQPHESLALTSYFNLVLAFNPGAAFSFLSNAGGWQKWFFIALALGISVWLVVMLYQANRLAVPDRLLSLALSMILGGALGNVIDRFRFDAVVDFLDFHIAGHHWPAFNVADSAITVGVALMLLHSLRQPAES